MSAVLKEVSEGIPTEGRIFEPPQENVDLGEPRYLTFIGNLITPEIATNRPWTKGGGIEVANPCLRFVKNFLRKGRITPLLKDTHNFLPYDMVKKIVDGEPTQNGYFRQTVPPGFNVPNLPPARGQGNGNIPSPTGNYVGKVALPGNQIDWILNGPANIYETSRRGIVEIRSLKGQPYKPKQFEDGTYVDPTIREIQLAIFPDYPRLPILLDDIERLIDDAKQHTMIREIVDVFEESFIQFRDYASSTIQNSHAKMREIAANNDRGYVPRYTALDLVLLEQLGMDRQDRQIAKAASSGDSEFKEMFRAFLESQKEEKEAMAGFLKSQTPVVDENTMKAQTIVNDSPARAEQIAEAMADTVLPNPVIKPEDLDLSGERPAHIHHKTWEKMQREASAKREE